MIVSCSHTFTSSYLQPCELEHFEHLLYTPLCHVNFVFSVKFIFLISHNFFRFLIVFSPNTGLQCIIVPPPRHADAPNYARTIMNLPQSSVDVWIRIPVLFKDVKVVPNIIINNEKPQVLVSEKYKSGNGLGHGEENKKRKLLEECNTSSKEKESNFNDNIVDISTKCWTLWDNFRHTSNSDKRVYIALEFFNHEDLAVCTEGMQNDCLSVLSYCLMPFCLLTYYSLISSSYFSILCRLYAQQPSFLLIKRI